MRPKNIFFFLTLILFLGNYLYAQESFTLKYKYKEGDTYKYKINSQTDVTQEVMGQEMKINVLTNIVQKYEAAKPEDNNIVLLLSVDSATVTTKMPGRDTSMTFNELLGKRQKLVVNERGNVLRRAQVDSVTGGGEMLKQVTSSFDKLLILPEKSIKTGETWNTAQVDTVSMMGGTIVTKSDIVCTLLGSEVKDGVNCIKIGMDTKSTNEGKASAMGMDLTIEGTGKSKGTFYFDQVRGIVVGSEMQVDGDMTMAATGQQNMIIPITQSTKATQTLIK